MHRRQPCLNDNHVLERLCRRSTCDSQASSNSIGSGRIPQESINALQPFTVRQHEKRVIALYGLKRIFAVHEDTVSMGLGITFDQTPSWNMPSRRKEEHSVFICGLSGITAQWGTRRCEKKCRPIASICVPSNGAGE